MSWVECSLNEIGSFKNGLNFKKDQMGSGYPLINVKDITSNILLRSKMLDLVDVSIKGKSASYLAEKGDVFFVRSSVKREGVGMVGMLDDDEKKTVHCGFVIRFRPKQDIIYSRFLLYLLSSPYWRESVRNLSGGTAIINVSQGALKTLSIKFPISLQTQKRIADILSAYDDLIENNLKRIKLLEQAAQNIYKEWFVNLRFPGHENTPINEETGLPEGWEYGVISHLCKFKSGYAFKSKHWKKEGNPVIKIKNINNNTVNIADSDFVDDEVAEIANKYELFPGDVIIAMTGATVGKVGLIPKIDKRIYLNQRVGL
ncbi:MAG: hypothetical protein HOH03_08540, partial [Candidatus Marinimicrobia bacterium]|nr:hypothetical protein [Candidatus Neomarinimicrobiota bacterium]